MSSHTIEETDDPNISLKRSESSIWMAKTWLRDSGMAA
jgi:hypothetical protein